MYGKPPNPSSIAAKSRGKHQVGPVNAGPLTKAPNNWSSYGLGEEQNRSSPTRGRVTAPGEFLGVDHWGLRPKATQEVSWDTQTDHRINLLNVQGREQRNRKVSSHRESSYNERCLKETSEVRHQLLKHAHSYSVFKKWLLQPIILGFASLGDPTN